MNVHHLVTRSHRTKHPEVCQRVLKTRKNLYESIQTTVVSFLKRLFVQKSHSQAVVLLPDLEPLQIFDLLALTNLFAQHCAHFGGKKPSEQTLRVQIASMLNVVIEHFKFECTAVLR
jgi:hypothetical protein